MLSPEEEDGLTFAVRAVQRASLPTQSAPFKLREFERGFEEARRHILQELREEQQRRFERRTIK